MLKGFFQKLFGRSPVTPVATKNASQQGATERSAFVQVVSRFVDIREVPVTADNIPTHIAVIMDGNGRWAKQKNLPRAVGHRQGVEALENIVEICGQLGVGHLTVYAFSTENWQRPKDEVSILMKLLVEFAEKKATKLCQNNVKIKVLGDMLMLPDFSRTALQQLITKTENNTGLVLNLAINYGSRWEILEAIKKIALQAKTDQLSTEAIAAIDEAYFSEFLETQGQPPPDLLIRTSGEHRLSNFLLWQLAYTEFYFTEVLWPDFNEEELLRAILYFQQRNRRFGGLK